MKHKITQFIAPAAALLLALSLAACGNAGATDSTPPIDTSAGSAPTTAGSSDASPAASTADPGTSGSPGSAASPEEERWAQGITDTEILVANSAAVSGAFEPIGVPFNAGIESYFAMVNEAGGIQGRTITLRHVDDEFDPRKGAEALKRFAEEDRVFAIVGHFGTPVVSATLDSLRGYGLPAVYFATGIGALYDEEAKGADRRRFPIQPIWQTEGRIMLARAVGDFGAKKVGVIYTDDDAGKSLLWGIERMNRELGLELVVRGIALDEADESIFSAVSDLKDAQVDIVLGAAVHTPMIAVIRELAEQEVGADVITTYVNVTPHVAQSVASVIAGKFDVYGSGWISFDGERAQALEEFARFTPEYATNVYAMTGWIAAHCFVEGLRRIDGTITWDKYVDAMEIAPVSNPFGGAIDFSNGLREGTQEMNLSKIDTENPAGAWTSVKPLQSIPAILGGR